jgi:integrase
MTITVTKASSNMIPANKGMILPAEPMSSDDVRTLIARIPHRTTTGKRNRALVRLLWESGLRISEALALKPGDIDFDKLELKVRRGKGGKYRTAYFAQEAKELLSVWLERRSAMGIGGRSPVFCTHAAKPINPAYCRAWFGRMSEKMGKRMHAHGLRAGFAINMARQSVPTCDISKALGHASLAATAVYLAKYPDESVGNAVRSCRW